MISNKLHNLNSAVFTFRFSLSRASWFPPPFFYFSVLSPSSSPFPFPCVRNPHNPSDTALHRRAHCLSHLPFYLTCFPHFSVQAMRLDHLIARGDCVQCPSIPPVCDCAPSQTCFQIAQYVSCCHTLRVFFSTCAQELYSVQHLPVCGPTIDTHFWPWRQCRSHCRCRCGYHCFFSSFYQSLPLVASSKRCPRPTRSAGGQGHPSAGRHCS